MKMYLYIYLFTNIYPATEIDIYLVICIIVQSVIYINKDTVIYIFKEKGGFHERIKGNPPSRVMSIQNDEI